MRGGVLVRWEVAHMTVYLINMGRRVVIETAAAPIFEPSFMKELSSHPRPQLELQSGLARGRWTSVLEEFSPLRGLATLHSCPAGVSEASSLTSSPCSMYRLLILHFKGTRPLVTAETLCRWHSSSFVVFLWLGCCVCASNGHNLHVREKVWIVFKAGVYDLHRPPPSSQC